jgi:hypothetical protein
MRTFRLNFMILFVFAFLLTGCAHTSRGDVGLLAGGVAGGAAGSVLTNGSPLGVVAGAVGGAFAGRELSR